MLREILKISTDTITIQIPIELRNKEVELLIFPLNPNFEKLKKNSTHLKFKTYKCGALLKNFTREDAYNEFI